jgi:hypothetical protein
MRATWIRRLGFPRVLIFEVDGDWKCGQGSERD